MKAFIQKLAPGLQRLRSSTSLFIGFAFLAVLAIADYSAPPFMTFTPFYMMGMAFLGWTSGFWPAAVFSVVSSIVTAFQDWKVAEATPELRWIVFLNASCRLTVFVGAGWLTAKLASLTRRLGNLVEERTALLQQETEQHKATSERLAEANERFQQVISNINEVFWLSDVPGFHIIYISPGYERVWGRPVEELYRDSKSWLQSVHPDDRDELIRRIPRDQPAGAYDAEYRIIRPDGTVRWIRDRAFPVLDAHGAPFRIAGLAQDITGQKRAEEVLKTRAAILENMAEAVLMVDQQAIITLTNPAADSLLGYERGELAGQPLHLVSGMPRDEYQRAFTQDFQAARAGKPIVREYQARRKDGSLTLVEVRTSGFSANSQYFLVLVGQDITERKRAQEALVHQEQLYRTLFELCPDGIILENTDGIILDANNAICQTHGYSRHELIGQSVRILATAETLPRIDGYLATLREGRNLDHEVWNVRKDGRRRLMRLNERPISLPDGKRGIMVVAADVTERRRDELTREALLALGTKLSSARTPFEAAQAMFDSADKLWEWHSATLDVYVPELDLMQHVVNYDIVDGTRREVPEVRSLLEPTPRMRKIMEHGPELVLRDQAGLPVLGSVKFGDVSRRSASIMCVPLRRDGRHVGVLSLQSYTRNAYDEQDLRKLQALADHCGSAMDRIRAEEALRESENRYRTLAESSPDAIFILDRDIKVQYVNSTAAAFWGRRPKDLIGRAQTELFPPETARRQSDVVTKVLQTGEIVHRDVEVPYPGGRIWQETRLAPMRAPNGEITSVMGISRDITERKRGEFLLRAQKDLAAGLSSTSDLKTAAGRLLEIAVQIEAIDCGYISLFDSITGALDLAAQHGLTKSGVERIAHFAPDSTQSRLAGKGKAAYFDNTKLAESETPLRIEDGLRAAAVIPLTHAGILLGAAILFSHTHDAIPQQSRDILETLADEAAGAIARIRVEEALHQSEARLRAFITAAPVLLFACDKDGVITLEDGLALKALGVEPGARVGQSVFELFAHIPTLLDNVRRALQGEEFSSIVEIGPCAFDCWYSPVRDKLGGVVGFNGVGTNITERHRLERQILEISDREQARIGQDLHDGLCQQLVTLAFDANSLQTELAGHDYPESARAGRIAGFLDEAITEARHLARGLFPVRLESEGLSPALQELANTTRSRFNVQCRFRSRGKVGLQNSAAATHLYRIAQESVNNAIRHGKARNILINLRERADELELQISDDGAGFSTKNRNSAAGMGLHIMDYRARALGGILNFNHRTEGGTMVSCCIPRPQGQ